MANDDIEELEEEGGSGGGGDDHERSSEGGGSKKLIIVIGLALLLVIGGVAAAYFAGLFQPLIDMLGGGESGKAKEEQKQPQMVGGAAVFYDLPEILVNLNNTGRKSSFLKLRVSLELESALDVPKVEAMMPRIIDNFQVYLRELRLDDLKGSAGMYRLREELLTRVTSAVAPAKVNDVLFKEMLVQ